MDGYFFPFEKLEVWQQSIELAGKIFDLLDRIPQNRHARLISQMEAAAVSPAQNIAEGKGRQHNREFIQFLFIARGSIFEVMTLNTIFAKKGLVAPEEAKDVRKRCEIIDRKLIGLINSLKGKVKKDV